MTKSLEVSPIKSLAEEIELARQRLRECLEAYGGKLDQDLAGVRANVLAQGNAAKLPAAKLRDLRDMLTLCRTLDVRPEKGRRKDLKKFEGLVEELGLLMGGW